jgi:hypothetical protein
MKTIQQLRKDGYKVRVLHSRIFKSIILPQLSPTGGETIIQITTPDGKITVEGRAICSDKDNFNRKTGNFIALGRAMKQIQEVK